MNWDDLAVILSKKKFGENSLIVTTITKERGLYYSIVKNCNSKKNRNLIEIGNIVQTRWNSRLEDGLGIFNFELIDSIFPNIINDKEKLYGLQAICFTLTVVLTERQVEDNIFNLFILLLESIKGNKNWKEEYVYFELTLLSDLGFGLDLSECVATGLKEDLTHISPKSGQAVSKIAAKPYLDKLIDLPDFLIDKNIIPSQNDLVRALNLTNYFINKNFFLQKRLSDDIRRKFIEVIKNKIDITHNPSSV